MTDKLVVKPYVRVLDEQTSIYENYARKKGLQSKSLQILLWLTNYPQLTGKYVTQKQLAEKTYSTKQVVNATIKNWSIKGYIEFLENPSDRRHKLVRLTDVGQEFADTIIKPLNHIEQAALGALTLEEQSQLLALTAKYNEALKIEMDTYL